MRPKDAAAKSSAAPRSKGKALLHALPAHLPRVDRHHDIDATHRLAWFARRRAERQA